MMFKILRLKIYFINCRDVFYIVIMIEYDELERMGSIFHQNVSRFFIR
jgi:hypothetical protein